RKRRLLVELDQDARALEARARGEHGLAYVRRRLVALATGHGDAQEFLVGLDLVLHQAARFLRCASFTCICAYAPCAAASASPTCTGRPMSERTDPSADRHSITLSG